MALRITDIISVSSIQVVLGRIVTLGSSLFNNLSYSTILRFHEWLSIIEDPVQLAEDKKAKEESKKRGKKRAAKANSGEGDKSSSAEGDKKEEGATKPKKPRRNKTKTPVEDKKPQPAVSVPGLSKISVYSWS